LPPGIYQLSVGLESAQGQPLGHNEFEFAIMDAEELSQLIEEIPEESASNDSSSERRSRFVPFGQTQWTT
jgi:hypothetical protein